MCNCLKEIKEALIKNKGYHRVIIDLDNITTTNGSKITRNKTGQRIEVQYTHTRKDGKEELKWRKSFITHAFCPFCGVEFES